MLQTKDLAYQYPNGHQAVFNLTMQLHAGECAGIIGANGAGKSTLLKLFVGVFPPTSGQILIGGQPVNKKNLSDIRRKVGLIFQNPDDQLFTASVYEDAAFALRKQKKSEAEIHTTVMQTLEALEITHLKDVPPYQLSGGEKKRAAIAAVLAMQPDILLLDEPSAFLDPRARRELIQLLKKLPHTKLIASHDLDFVQALCSRVFLLEKGNLCADGPAETILNNSDFLYRHGL